MDFLLKNEMAVFIVVYDKETFMLSEKLFPSYAQYVMTDKALIIQ